MSWVQIWVHMVFSTKCRKPFLQSAETRRIFFAHIIENAKEKGVWLDRANGYTDHIHCLISLGKEQQLSKVAQLIKGESSYWINRSGLLNSKFIWQDDYWAVSVSKSHLSSVRKYIDNQEKHHAVTNFDYEVNGFMKKHGWELVKDIE